MSSWRDVVLKKKMMELEAVKSKVHQEINAESSEPEALRTKLATQKLLNEDELRAKAITEVKETRQWDIQELKEHIKSFAKRN